MRRERPSDIGRSILRRLANAARRNGEDPQVTQARFAAERFLYRLSVSRYKDRFVLKGAMLFFAWDGFPHRPTRDLDLLGFGEMTLASLREIVTVVCGTASYDDGLAFLPDSMTVNEIREQEEYGGLRVRMTARLGRSEIPLQVDVGIGDVVVPPPGMIAYPTILEMPAPSIRAYSRESVVAEKLHAMVKLGLANSRMKDLFDVWIIARESRIAGGVLCEAVAATFQRRMTSIPSADPAAFGEEFSSRPEKIAQWVGFLKRADVTPGVLDLGGVAVDLRSFLRPPLQALREGVAFDVQWQPGGPWRVVEGSCMDLPRNSGHVKKPAEG